MPRATVLLADDHAIVAEGLASLLGGEFALVGTVADGAQLVETARRLRPDLIVTDLAMPGLNGLDALRQLKADGLAARVVVLTMHADAHVAAEVLRAGASGFVVKHAAGQELIAALHAVLRGRRYVSPDLADDVLATLSEPPATGAGTLTPRQRDVVSAPRRGGHDEGSRRHPRALAPHGRDPQVPEHGGARAQDDGGADPLRPRARPDHTARARVAAGSATLTRAASFALGARRRSGGLRLRPHERHPVGGGVRADVEPPAGDARPRREQHPGGSDLLAASASRRAPRPDRYGCETLTVPLTLK